MCSYSRSNYDRVLSITVKWGPDVNSPQNLLHRHNKHKRHTATHGRLALGSQLCSLCCWVANGLSLDMVRLLACLQTSAEDVHR